MRIPLVLLVAVFVLTSGSVALAANRDAAMRPAAEFSRTEFEVLGSAASRTFVGPLKPWRQIGGDEIGGGGAAEPDEVDEGGPSNLGDKVKAGALSAVLPGAGQFYNDQKKKAFIMAGVEVGIWSAFFIFDHQGDNRMASARDWAGAFAGTGGSHDDSYWQSVGKFMDSDAYNESLLREARALNEAPPSLIGGSDAWQWVNNDRRVGYAVLRSEGNSAYDRRDFMILFAVINRAVSVVDAVIGAGGKPNALETEVLGLDLELEMLPSWRDPGARWVVSRSF